MPAGSITDQVLEVDAVPPSAEGKLDPGMLLALAQHPVRHGVAFLLVKFCQNCLCQNFVGFFKLLRK